MDDVIEAWATRLAEAVAPDEADLAPDIAAAYVAGGRERAELFRASAATPGGFDPGAVLAVFPFVLSAIAASGALIQAFLASGAADIPGMVKDVVDLRDRYRRGPERAAAKSTTLAETVPENQHAYQALNRIFIAIEEELGKAGIDAQHRQLLSYRIVRGLLDDLGGTREFLDAVGASPGRK
jgi:hypothetical protein